MPLISGQLKPGSFNQVIDMLHLDFDVQTFDDVLLAEFDQGGQSQ